MQGKNIMNIINSKLLKVAYSNQIRKDDAFMSGQTRRVSLPKIQMEGKWLDELGFHIGDQIKVDYGMGFIQISIAEQEMEPALVSKGHDNVQLSRLAVCAGKGA